MAAAIEFLDVHKRYRLYRHKYSSLKELALHRRLGVWEDRWALRGVSFEVPRGGTYGLLCPNGAGKSTALKVMARILVPEKGRVDVQGRVAGLIELGSGFSIDFTGRENVYLNASLLGLTRREIDERYDEIVDFAELGDRMEDPLRTYSSGMQMKLGFSTAIHVRPDVMLIDEILAVGDEAFQRKCFQFLDRFVGGGGTIVLVSHNLSAIRDFCAEAAWIQDGAVQLQGRSTDVIDEYLDRIRDEQVAAQAGALEEHAVPLEITSVKIVDGTRKPRFDVETGDTLLVEVAYQCREPLPSAAFGISVHRSDGVYVYGTNTVADGMPLDLEPGAGTMLLRFECLQLMAGTYKLVVAAFKTVRGGAPASDVRQIEPAFRVRNRGSDEGTVRLTHLWLHEQK